MSKRRNSLSDATLKRHKRSSLWATKWFNLLLVPLAIGTCLFALLRPGVFPTHSEEATGHADSAQTERQKIAELTAQKSAELQELMASAEGQLGKDQVRWTHRGLEVRTGVRERFPGILRFVEEEIMRLQMEIGQDVGWGSPDVPLIHRRLSAAMLMVVQAGDKTCKNDISVSKALRLARAHNTSVITTAEAFVLCPCTSDTGRQKWEASVTEDSTMIQQDLHDPRRRPPGFCFQLKQMSAGTFTVLQRNIFTNVTIKHYLKVLDRDTIAMTGGGHMWKDAPLREENGFVMKQYDATYAEQEEAIAAANAKVRVLKENARREMENDLVQLKAEIEGMQEGEGRRSLQSRAESLAARIETQRAAEKKAADTRDLSPDEPKATQEANADTGQYGQRYEPCQNCRHTARWAPQCAKKPRRAAFKSKRHPICPRGGA